MNQTCPHCGYCPTCNTHTAPAPHPAAPVYPFLPYQPYVAPYVSPVTVTYGTPHIHGGTVAQVTSGYSQLCPPGGN